MKPIDRVDVFDLMAEAAREALTGESKVQDHFSTRHVASCPRTLWFRAHNYPYSNLPGLATVMMMEWGKGAENAEFQHIANMDPAKLGNTMDMEKAISKYPLLKHYVDEAEKLWQGQFMVIGRNAIQSLPIHFEWPGVKRPIHGVIDILLLMNNRPVIIEVKETRGRSASNLRAGGKPWSSWVAQLYMYCHALNMPGELHVWGRDTGYHTKFIIDERKGQVCLDGTPYLFETNLGDLRPEEYVSLRLSYVEEALESDTPPGRARVLAGGRIIEPLFDDLPMPSDEIYRLVLSRKGTPTRQITYKGTQYHSRRCDRCWDRDSCMGTIIEKFLAGDLG